MTKQRRNRAKVLTDETLKRLKAQIRQHECDENGAIKYSLEKLGELTGLDPETVGKVLSQQGNDKRILDRCCNAFGITLTKEDYSPASKTKPPEIDPSFVGREEAIAHLHELVHRDAKVIAIQARGGIGKTTLARKFLAQEFDTVLEFPIAKETKDIASIESLLEEKLRQLGEEPGREFMVSCDRLKRKLQNERIGILIDNLEPALDSAGRFIEPHRRYVEVLRILADPSVQSTTLITTRERLRESSITVQTYLLKSLDVVAWKEFFESRSLATDTSALAALHNAYGGNAKAMEIISGAIAQDFDGDVDEYWQENQDDLFIERDLEDLVKQQFERLQEQHLDAYNLLCRMGCYRYQDVPTVPIEGLFCLMWDVPEKEHKRVVKVLRDRSLIEFLDGRFWLHQILREEAVSKLREDENWEAANQKSAQYWQHSINEVATISDALNALESYYHFVQISNYEEACNVITYERQNKWIPRLGPKQGSTLGWSLYRLGLLRKLEIVIQEIKDFLPSDYGLSKLYSLLGITEWTRGSIKKAIQYHLRSNEIVKDKLKQQKYADLSKSEILNLKILRVINHINIGLCLTNLTSYEKACEHFEKALCLVNLEEEIMMIFKDIEIYLTFARLKQGKEQVTSQKIEELSQLLLDFKWGIRSQGYGLYTLAKSFKELGQNSRAVELYRDALDFAKDASYKQVEGKVLCGLSVIAREDNQMDKAISLSLKSIKILNDIDASFDLAEAYYSLALTYKMMKREGDSKEAFYKAMNLFQKIDSPQQVCKIMSLIAC